MENVYGWSIQIIVLEPKAGIVLVTSEDRSICYALKLNFPTTNNKAEYETLIAGLKLAKELEIKSLEIFCNSLLVVYQVRRDYQAKGQRLAPYLIQIQELLTGFEYYDITHLPRDQNKETNSLVKFDSTGDAQQMGLVPVEVLNVLSINQIEIDWVLETEPEKESWMTPIKDSSLQ